MKAFLSNIFVDVISANQFSSIFRFLIALLISVLLVRSSLSNEEVGQLEYFILLANSFSFYWAFAYSSAVLSKLGNSSKSDVKIQLQQVVWQLVIIAACNFILILSIIHIFSLEQHFVFSSWMLPLFSSSIILGSVVECYYLLNDKAKELSLFSIILNLLFLVFISIGLLFDWSISLIILLYLSIQLLRFFWTLFVIKPSFSIDLKSQKDWILFTFPLVLYFVLGSSMDYVDGHIIRYFFNEEQFLYYRYGARELPISILVMNALATAMIPLLSRSLENLVELRRRVSFWMKILFPVSAILMFLSPFLFSWVYGTEFRLSALVFNYYLLIISSRMLLPHSILYAKKENTQLLIYSAIEGVINVILSLLFLQVLGMVGVALATVIAFLINRILLIIHVRRRHRISLNQYLPIREYLSFMMILVFCFFISYYWMYG